MQIIDRRVTRHARQKDELTVPCTRCPRRVLTSAAMRLVAAPAGVDRKAAEYLCPRCSKGFTADWYASQRDVAAPRHAGSLHPMVLLLTLMGAITVAFARQWQQRPTRLRL